MRNKRGTMRNCPKDQQAPTHHYGPHYHHHYHDYQHHHAMNSAGRRRWRRVRHRYDHRFIINSIKLFTHRRDTPILEGPVDVWACRRSYKERDVVPHTLFNFWLTCFFMVLFSIEPHFNQQIRQLNRVWAIDLNSHEKKKAKTAFYQGNSLQLQKERKDIVNILVEGKATVLKVILPLKFLASIFSDCSYKYSKLYTVI